MDGTKEITTFRCHRILFHLEKENSTACDRRDRSRGHYAKQLWQVQKANYLYDGDIFGILNN